MALIGEYFLLEDIGPRCRLVRRAFDCGRDPLAALMADLPEVLLGEFRIATAGGYEYRVVDAVGAELSVWPSSRTWMEAWDRRFATIVSVAADVERTRARLAAAGLRADGLDMRSCGLEAADKGRAADGYGDHAQRLAAVWARAGRRLGQASM